MASLTKLFTDIADAIRAKTGRVDSITASYFPDVIEGIKDELYFNYANQEITSISDYAFYRCVGLKNVSAYNLTSIGISAFEGCTSLNTITLYNGVSTVGKNAFKDCDNVTIYCEATSKPDGWDDDWNPDNRPVVWGLTPVGTYDISDSSYDSVICNVYNTGDIYTAIISGNGHIFWISDPSSGGLKLPLFWQYREKINFAIILDGITDLGGHLFRQQKGLISVHIPDSVMEFGDTTFYLCENLQYIHIPDGVNYLDQNVFGHCKSLLSIKFPDTVQSINSSLSGCSNLRSVSLPNGLTYISSYAFSGCHMLKSLSIPSSVTEIYSYAFSNCSSMEYYDFTTHTSIPSLSSTIAFENIPSDCQIRVPASLYDEWIAATNWSTYADYIVAV